MSYKIKDAKSLVTTKKLVRKGFIDFANKRNDILKDYINEAKLISKKIDKIKTSKELEKKIGNVLIDAAGLSVKSRKFFNNEDIKAFTQNFLKQFKSKKILDIKDDIIFRYLLTKGDALGGKMRNVVGNLAEEKFKLCLIDNLKNSTYKKKIVLKSNKIIEDFDGIHETKSIKFIIWKDNEKLRSMAFNLNVPITNKNIDIVIFNKDVSEILQNFEEFKKNSKNYLCLGELKGGIDPAGADEHWKTASTSLFRIRNSFQKKNNIVNTFFVGAAIEENMSKEIFALYKNNAKFNCSNLNNNIQLNELIKWIIKL